MKQNIPQDKKVISDSKTSTNIHCKLCIIEKFIYDDCLKKKNFWNMCSNSLLISIYVKNIVIYM